MRTRKIADLLCRIIIICIVPITLFLFVTSSAYKFDSLSSDNYSYQNPAFLLAIPLFIIVAFVFGKVLHLVKKKIPFFDWIIVGLLTIIWSVISYKFVVGARELPSSDASACYILANQFLASDFKAVVPKDSYLSLWPFQSGLIFILEKTMRIFNTTDVLFFQKINVLYGALGMVSGFGILRELSKRDETLATGILLIFSDVVLPIECPFIYGNIPCFNLIVFATWMFIRMYKCNRKRTATISGVLGFAATLLACVYKGNALIFVIALLGYTFLKMLVEIKRKRYRAFFLAIILVSLICVLSGSLITKYYETYAQNTMGKGVPKIAFVAMGLQGNGGWNGFHSDTFMETDYDYEKTTQISIESIKNSISYFAYHPKMAAKFFYKKNIKQWDYETRAAYWKLNLQWDEPRNGYAISAESGKIKGVIEVVSDVRLSLIYVLISVGLIASLFKKNDEGNRFFTVLGALYFLGGFMFLCVWEAHSEYTVSYINVLLPLALPFIGTPIYGQLNKVWRAFRNKTKKVTS